MTLTINLSPEFEKRLEEEAARKGQPPLEFARTLLEEGLKPVPLRLLPEDGLPPDPPEALLAHARANGIMPLQDPSVLMGDWSTGPEDDFDVDEFLEARKRWKWEGRPSFPFRESAAEPHEK